SVLDVTNHLDAVHRIRVVEDAVIEPGGVTFQVLLHPHGVLRQYDRAGLSHPHLDRLVPEGVARSADDHHAAVAEQVIVAVELEIGEITRVVIIGHDVRPAALELLRPPGLVQFLLLDHVDGIREHLDVADVVQVGVRGDDDLDVVDREADLFELLVDD
ncbi:hypothetical protein GBAR_LOCUS17773, partial [Geodia barretti]